ncbi:hypothetical protein [Metapseudomonas resinovorans]|uniref:hypothetical protein n=1 Tax=Metapseudomonas resinovorans TaxID=53412 RepID=UPI00048CB80B|nr:hypothetical protein [Pseudomonas resinovorans]
MSTLPKRELIDQSIGNIFKLLTDILCSPGSYVDNEQILYALKSQGRLCALNLEFAVQDKQFAIRPISLNTLKKRLSDNYSDRNFQQLDKLRLQAQMAIRKYSEELTAPQKTARSALEDQVEELKASVATLHAVNMVLIQALEVNRRDLITIFDTANTGLRQKRVNDAINRIVRILGMNPPPFDDVTLLSTKKHLQLVPNEQENR